jgi:hypothetical protein
MNKIALRETFAIMIFLLALVPPLDFSGLLLIITAIAIWNWR